jgi:predicted ribosome-associated RNA-binding protein Tma20
MGMLLLASMLFKGEKHYFIEIRGVVKCTAEVHLTQNKAVVDEGAVRILRKQWTPEYKQQFFKKLG